MTRARRPLLSSVLLAVVLQACAVPVEPAPSGGQVTLLLFGDAVELAGYDELVTAYARLHPDVTVGLTPVATQDDLLAKLTTSFAAGSPPDVFLINFRKYGQFAAQGLLEPVGPRLATSDVVSEDDLYAGPVDAFRFDGGELTCVPQNVSSLVAYYNRDLFAEAGVPEPPASWTWDEFLTTAEALTDADAGVYGLGIDPKVIRLAPFVWSNGGQVVDDERAPTTLTVDVGPARDALDWFLDLQLEHHVVPDDAAEQSEDAQSRFLNGRLAMYLDSRRVTPTMRTITDFAWDVAPLPVAPGGEPVTMLHSDAYCLPAGDNADAGWSLIEFAMSEEGQTILAQSGRTVPSRRDVAASDAFLVNELGPARAQVFLDNAEIVRATPHVPTWSAVEKQADAILEQLFYGRIDRAEGIRRLIAETRPVFGPRG